MPWITTDDGQHVFVGPGGGFQPGGPGSKAKFVLSSRKGSQSKLGLKGGQSGAAATVDRARAGVSKPAQPTALQHQAAALAKARGKLQAAQGKEVGRIAQVQQNPTKFAQPGDVAQVKVKDIAFDPERFQYKLDVQGGHGVTDEMKGVKQWNPESAGVISVWKDPADGKTYVINGHHRLDLANKLGVNKITARYLDAPDAETAKFKGAITNIAEGRGTAIDAAKVFRGTGDSHETIAKAGIPLTEAKAKQGSDMAGLSDHLFKKVIDREIPVGRAALIGGAGLNEAQQKTVYEQALKRRASDATVKELVDNAREAHSVTKTTRSLFGDDEEEVSLAFHRAKVAASVSKSLSSDQKLFGLVSKSKNSEALAERGQSHIDTEETGKVSEEAKTVLGVFHTLKNRSGPVAAALNHASERLHAGHKEAEVMKEARTAITGHVGEMLKGGSNAFAA